MYVHSFNSQADKHVSWFYASTTWWTCTYTPSTAHWICPLNAGHCTSWGAECICQQQLQLQDCSRQAYMRQDLQRQTTFKDAAWVSRGIWLTSTSSVTPTQRAWCSRITEVGFCWCTSTAGTVRGTWRVVGNSWTTPAWALAAAISWYAGRLACFSYNPVTLMYTPATSIIYSFAVTMTNVYTSDLFTLVE